MEIVYNMRLRIEQVIQDLEVTRSLVDFIGDEDEINIRLKVELVERINRVICILLTDEDLLNELEVCENKLDVLKILERDGILKQEVKSKKKEVENNKDNGPLIN